MIFEISSVPLFIRLRIWCLVSFFFLLVFLLIVILPQDEVLTKLPTDFRFVFEFIFDKTPVSQHTSPYDFTTIITILTIFHFGSSPFYWISKNNVRFTLYSLLITFSFSLLHLRQIKNTLKNLVYLFELYNNSFIFFMSQLCWQYFIC